MRGEFYVVSKNMPVMLRLVRSNDEPTAGGALGGGPAQPIITREQTAQLHRRGQGGGGQGADPLHLALRLHAQPDQRHDRDRPAVVAHHGLRPEHRRDQVARAARRRDGAARQRHPGGRRVAHAARRSAGHGRRPGVRGHGVRSHRARLRPRFRQGGVEHRSADRLRGRAGILRGERPAVHRVPGRGRHRRVLDPVRGPPPQPPANDAPEAQGGAARGRGGRAGGPPPVQGAYIVYALPAR